MNLLKSQQKENIENANVSVIESANENGDENIKMEPNVDFKHPCVQCECDKTFLTIVGLSQHMESAHPQSSQDVDTMPDVNSNIKKIKKPGFKHQCLLCERRFLKRDGLVQHMDLNHPQSPQDCVPTPEAAPIEEPTAPAEASPAPIEASHAPVEASLAPVEGAIAPVKASPAPVETEGNYF